MTSDNLGSLLKKYNIQGPRYTSYPTVPYWEKSPSEEEWIRELKASLQKDVGAALYVHIPFCESLCNYCGCNTRITRKKDVGAPYVDTVLKEWTLYRNQLGTIQISDLHLGGGTPTFLSPMELARLVEGLLKNHPVSDQAEFSIEVDPRVTTKEHLETLYSLGFRRLSMGVQDFDPEVQDAVRRRQSPRMVQELTDSARQLGFTSVNFDLIYGLPFQSLERLEETFQEVARIKPDRIAFYSYAHVPWIKPSQRRWSEEDLPSGSLKQELYQLGRRALEANAYQEIGMDHFALETDSLWKAAESKTLHRNFMGYIPQHSFPLIGLGVSSISDSWNAFSQNEKVIEKYTRLVEAGRLPLLRGHVLTTEDRALRKHILNLMTRFETHWEGSETHLYTDFIETVPNRLVEMEKDGLVEIERSKCRITPQGRPFIRNICMAFDARLSRKRPEFQIFSKTI